MVLIGFPQNYISTKVAFNDFKLPKNSPLTKEEFLKGSSNNTFTNWAKEKFPEIKNIFGSLEKLGKPKLSGTGSTLFLSFETEKEAKKALVGFPEGILVKSLDDSPLRLLME